MKRLMKVVLSAALMVVLALTCVAILFTLKYLPFNFNSSGSLGGSLKVNLNCSLTSFPSEVPRLKVVMHSTITKDFVVKI